MYAFSFDGARHIPDTWERGDPYERYVGRWSRQVAPRFLTWLDIEPGRKWLDVGCGTGALSTAIAQHGRHSLLAGVEPSHGFLQVAQRNLAEKAALYLGNATHIALADSSVNVVVSGLVLNFVADRLTALREMARVTASGGVVAAYVWDYAGKMELMRILWDTASELNPNDLSLDEGIRFPFCNPDALRQLFADAGLRSIEVTALDILTPFASFEDYWQPFLGGQGSAPSYVMSLNAVARLRLRDRLRERLPVEADGSIRLAARAWAIRAFVEK